MENELNEIELLNVEEAAKRALEENQVAISVSGNEYQYVQLDPSFALRLIQEYRRLATRPLPPVNAEEMAKEIAEKIYDWMIGLEPNGNFLPASVACDFHGKIRFKQELTIQISNFLSLHVPAMPSEMNHESTLKECIGVCDDVLFQLEQSTEYEQKALGVRIVRANINNLLNFGHREISTLSHLRSTNEHERRNGKE